MLGPVSPDGPREHAAPATTSAAARMGPRIFLGWVAMERLLSSEGRPLVLPEAGLLAPGSSLPDPSQGLRPQWRVSVRSPVTVARPRRIPTGFPLGARPDASRRGHLGDVFSWAHRTPEVGSQTTWCWVDCRWISSVR